MPNKHANPMLGWRPPAGLSAWVRDEAARRGVDLKVILDEALERYRMQSGEGELGGLAEVICDNLLTAYERWNDELSGEELDAISQVRHALMLIDAEDGRHE